MNDQVMMTRRALLARTCRLAAGAGIGGLGQFGPLGSALANGHGGLPGYKALVCVYLAGGNDSFNLLVPRDSLAIGSRYDTYRLSRGGVFDPNGNPFGLALGFDQLLDIGVPIGQSTAFGVHPQCSDYVASRNGQNYLYPGMHSIYGSGKLAFVANVGPLIELVSKTDFNAGAPRPPQLYSHNDQELLWNLGIGDNLATTGWGGRVLDRIDAGGHPALPPCISVAGNSRFQIGSSVFPYQMSASQGAAQLLSFDAATTLFGEQRRLALQALLEQGTTHLLQNEYRNTLLRSRELEQLVRAALNSPAGQVLAPYDYRGPMAPDPGMGFYPDANLHLFGEDYPNRLLDQLRMVVRMIRLSRDPGAGVNHSRQIYYVRLGGFDTHAGQMTQQPLLLAQLSQALGWFWQALAEIGAQDQVVAFTMSEFGRTLSSNGDGSDHAWGGVQAVLGGEVIGQRIHGRYPQLRLDADDDSQQDWSFARGQYIPTVATEQMAATLARWFGLPAADLDQVFPNLSQFSGPLSFLPLS